MLKQFSNQIKYSDNELELIKAIFAENDDLLLLIRKVFFQEELTEEEQKTINNLSEETIKILKKSFLPEIDSSGPILNTTDLWSSIDFKNQSSEKILDEIKARLVVEDYFKQQFEVLEGKPIEIEKEILLKKLTPSLKTDNEMLLIDIVLLSARNTIIQHIDFILNSLRILAGQKKESVEETLQRLAKNSNR